MHGFNTLFLQKGIHGKWSIEEGLVHNRAFLFGDGLFETMVFSQGELKDFSLHQIRLFQGMELLGLSKNTISTQEDLEQLINHQLTSQEVARIRWNVFRSGLGKYSPESSEMTETLQIQTFIPAPTVKKSAMVSQKHRLFPHIWANCKTSNALVYVLANKERIEVQQDEIILLDHLGNISEAGAANIFWKKGNVYYTPSLQTNCIAGIGRAKIIATLQAQSQEVRQGEFPVASLLAADKVFVSNVTGISYLAEVEGSHFDTQPENHLETLFQLS
ncbi:MAG: aminotransferase class IV [Mongoliitalea sp.]